MAKDPAVLFYTSDFLSGTSFFTMEQRGQYITLLCEQHQNGHIPDNHMIDICKSYDSCVCKKFIKDENGLWYNLRMEEEHKKRSNYCESRSKNRKEGTIKKSYDTTHVNHMSQHMDNGNDNDIKDVSLKDKEVKEKKEKKDKFIPPSKIEVHEYFFEKGYSGLSADRFYEGYHAADWHDSQGKKIRNWKQKAQHVWFKEENQIGYKKDSGQKYGRQEVTMDQLHKQAERIPLCEKSILDQISDTCKPISEQ